MTLHIDITKWSIPQSYCIYSAAQDGEALYSQQKQDLELIVAEIISSLLQNSGLLKKVGKTTRPFMYELKQIPSDYKVEVMHRFRDYIW